MSDKHVLDRGSGRSSTPSPVTVHVRIEPNRRAHDLGIAPWLRLRVIGRWLHWVASNGLLLLLRGWHHRGVGGLDNVVIEVGDRLKHARVAKVLGARR